MFYLLIIIGLFLIVLGLFKNKDINENPAFQSSFDEESQELRKLKYRIENLENMMFYNDDKSEDDLQIKEEQQLSDSLKIYEKICKYEKENYSLEEISGFLAMNKGEVILLKNLYKNY